jgi:hypothetical protein
MSDSVIKYFRNDLYASHGLYLEHTLSDAVWACGEVHGKRLCGMNKHGLLLAKVRNEHFETTGMNVLIVGKTGQNNRNERARPGAQLCEALDVQENRLGPRRQTPTGKYVLSWD